MEVSEVLENALEYMKKHGRTTGEAINEQGQVCAIGAVNRVAYYLHTDYMIAARNYLNAYARKQGFDGETLGVVPAAELNDTSTTTDEDVYLMFKHAIEMAKEYECKTQSLL